VKRTSPTCTAAAGRQQLELGAAAGEVGHGALGRVLGEPFGAGHLERDHRLRVALGEHVLEQEAQRVLAGAQVAGEAERQHLDALRRRPLEAVAEALEQLLAEQDLAGEQEAVEQRAVELAPGSLVCRDLHDDPSGGAALAAGGEVDLGLHREGLGALGEVGAARGQGREPLGRRRRGRGHGLEQPVVVAEPAHLGGGVAQQLVGA
jgi:hypothetical protein